METLERAQGRLDHIRTVAPILGALRTISLGMWSTALRQSTHVREYEERLARILPALAPHLEARLLPRLPAEAGRPPLPVRRQARQAGAPEAERIAALVVGSERGLCGRFNAAVVERAAQYLAEQEATGAEVELLALGSRVSRLLRRRGWSPVWWGKLPVATLPPYRIAFDLISQWLGRYEEHELDGVDLIYNTYSGPGRYETAVARLIPRPVAPSPSRPLAPSPPPPISSSPWPPPIIETDPLGLYTRAVALQAAASLYRLLLESAAAEHATRYQLMESAVQNANRLIDELALVIQMERQQEITQQMQELAAGAGLIGPPAHPA